MTSKTLINGTGYSVRRGKILINGTGYTINRGRTLIGGAGYTIGLVVRYTRIIAPGTYWAAGSDTTSFSETSSSLKAELNGSPSSSGGIRFYIGFRLYADPGDSISVTVNANAAGTYSDNEIKDTAAGRTIASNTSRWNNETIQFSCPDSGYFDVLAANGNKNLSYRWVEITKVTINGTQIFPAA